jgi:hypothetical protein
MLRYTIPWIALMLSAGQPACLGQAAGAINLAPLGRPRSWLPSSLPSPHAPLERAVDGDPLTFWASTEPSLDPPKDIGIEWDEPQTVGAVRARFWSVRYVPAGDGWALEALTDGEWQGIEARVENPDCEWWTFRFEPTTTRAIRLLVSRYARNRPSICEFEVYPSSPPPPGFRRPPVLDGAFWAFHYKHWAEQFAIDASLADEVAFAHRIGLDTIILYTITGRDGVFSTVVPGTNVPQSQWWDGRDPVEAILAAADALAMTVYLGDAPPTGFSAPADPEEEVASGKLLNEYRAQMIRRYEKHPSLVGYYINFECCPDNYGNDPTVPARQSDRLGAHVKDLCPRLRVIQPVGLYRWRDSKQGAWRQVAPVELERFWRPWIESAEHIDVYMVIDGVGTGLAPLNYTDVNQACVRRLCDGAGKEMWTDVECADFSDYSSMPMGRLRASIEVAAQHAEQLVTFCYFNYMSPNNGREGSRRLYEAYKAYREEAIAPDG